MYQQANMNKAKTVVSGGAYLTAAIAVTLIPLSKILAGRSSANLLSLLMDQLYENLPSLNNMPDVVYYARDLLSLSTGNRFMTALFQLPILLFAVGLWLVWLGARDAASGEGKTKAGAGIVRFYITLQYILKILSFALTVFYSVAAPIFLWIALGELQQNLQSWGISINRGVTVGIMLGVGVVLMIASWIQMWFWKNARKSAKGISDMLLKGDAPSIRRLFINLCYVVGGFSCVGSLASVLNLPSFIAAAAGAAAWIAFGIFQKQIMTDVPLVVDGTGADLPGAAGAAAELSATSAAFQAASAEPPVPDKAPLPPVSLPENNAVPELLPEPPFHPEDLVNIPAPKPAVPKPAEEPVWYGERLQKKPTFDLPIDPLQPNPVQTPAAPPVQPKPAYTPPVVQPAQPKPVYTPPAQPRPVYTPPAQPAQPRPAAPRPVQQPVPQAAPVRQNALLLQRKTGDNIPITSASFTLGRNPSMCTFAIPDNPVVSGCHATILWSGTAYYLVDNNSRNHVYLDGKMLQPGVKARLNHCSQFRLGNEEFVFILY